MTGATKSYPVSSFGSTTVETVGSYPRPCDRLLPMNNRVLAFVLALAAGLGGAYAYQRFLGEGKQSTSPTPARPMPPPTGGSAKGAPKVGAAKDSEPAAAREAASDELDFLAQLVPLDAFLYVEAESIESLASVLQQSLSSVDPMLAAGFDLQGMVQMNLARFGADAAAIDGSRPIALALSMPGGAQEPVPTFILPVSAPDAFVESLGLPPETAEPERRGDYVGIALGPNYRLGSKPSTLALDLPPGVVAARVRLAPIRALMDQGLSQFEGRDMSGMNAAARSSYALGREYGKRLLTELEEVDLGWDVRGETMAMHLGARFADGSPFVLPAPREAVDLASLVRFAGPEDQIVMATCWSQELLAGPVKDLILAIGEASGELSPTDQAELEKALAFAPLAGQQAVFFGDLELGNLRCGAVLRPPTAGPVLEGIRAGIERSPLSLLLAAPLQVTEIEDGQALSARISLAPAEDAGWDPETRRTLQGLALLCGSEEVELRAVARGGDLALFFASDAAWLDESAARVGREGATDPTLGAAVSAMQGANPGAFTRLDVGGVVRELLRLSAEHMGLDPSEDLRELSEGIGDQPLWLQSVSFARGARWQGTVEFDSERFNRLGRILSGMGR